MMSVNRSVHYGRLGIGIEKDLKDWSINQKMAVIKYSKDRCMTLNIS